MSSHLIACLALYQYQQDKAVGINWLSARTRGLLWYYNHIQQKQLADLMTAAYLNGIIQQGAKEIKELASKAKEAENKQEILEYAIIIQSEIEQAERQLNELEKR
jgi:DNA-directed RNA polymerase